MTKAQTLLKIKDIPDINVLPVLVIKSEVYFAERDRIVSEVINFANNHLLIVRSSSIQEDGQTYSNAGKFDSILNVKPEKETIISAIEGVYKSYNTKYDEEILIQPMLDDVVKSGVIFTRDIDTNAEYYIVNYQESSDTTAITGGGAREMRTFVHYRYSPFQANDRDLKILIEKCNKIEEFLGNDALDIEFAVTSDGTIYILQVRPIAVGNKDRKKSLDIGPALNRIYKKAQKLSREHPFLLGHTTCFGVMPDWNPAEILGVRPKKLAISLYKELITDSIWAHQRADYGYRDLTMHPLMISFCGVPYIDTRITFNSFIPGDLNQDIAEKLACYYINKLSKYPKYHDKIEFEIVYSCYYLGLHQKLKKLLEHGFNENEITRIEFSLLNLTNNIIAPEKGLYLKDLEKIRTLEKNYKKIMSSNSSLVDTIYWLIEECKRYGTLPFAGVARAAFIAVQFLRSFVETGIITKKEYNAYMNSLDTINKQMNSDLRKYYIGEMSKEEFIEKYGHIRPGTYDIMSKRYDEAFDDYFMMGKYIDCYREEESFYFSEQVKQAIQKELDESGLLISVPDLMSFIKRSIEGREYLKFIFTKSVSKILQLVEELGKRFDISKEDMSYIDITVIRQLYMDLFTGDPGKLFRENISNNKQQYERAICIKLPSIIVKPEDVYSFFQLDEEPNYITQKSVTAETILIEDGVSEIDGKIVFIQSADPGYDFIFSKNIVGLITQFGGANSHMAIRCAELGIPAVIGVGESRFHEWSKWSKIELNSLMKQVIKIK